MTKKLLSILLCVTMILTSFVTVGFADEPARISFERPVVSFEDGTVTIPVAVGGTINLDKISSFTATYNYDPEKLTFNSIVSGKMIIPGSDETFVNSKVPGVLSIRWLADEKSGRPAVEKSGFASGGSLFSIKFTVVSGAMGTTDVTVVDTDDNHPEISSDDNFVRLDSSHGRATAELSFPMITLGEAKYTNGEIHIPVSLDRIPYAVDCFFNSFTMIYAFETDKLTYVRTDDGILKAEDAVLGKDYAVSGKIAYVNKNSDSGKTDGDIRSTGVMFTLVFVPADPATTGTTSVVSGNVEVGNRLEQTSTDFISSGTTVDFSKYVSVAEPKINITPVVKEDGVTVEAPVVLTKVPERFGGKLNSFKLRYTCDAEFAKHFKYVETKSDVFSGEFGSYGNISFYSDSPIPVNGPTTLATIVFKSNDCENDGYYSIPGDFAEIGIGDSESQDVYEIENFEINKVNLTKRDHVWGAWTKINETTEEHTCSVCGKKETRPIASVILSKIEASVASIDVPYATFAAGADAVKAYINGKYTVTATYSDASTATVTADAAIDVDAKLVKLSYTEKGVTKNAEITLNVGTPMLTKIEARKGTDVITSLEIPFGIDSLDDIKTYIESQGIEVYGIYEDDNSTKVAATLAVDETKATYTFDGKDAVITLTRPAVVLDSIEVDPTELDIPYATVKAGEDAVKEFIKGKYTVTAKYNSGSTFGVSDKATVTVDTAANKIIVSYTEDGVTKDAAITIKRGEALPEKLIVKQGDTVISEIKYCDITKIDDYVATLNLKVYTVYEDNREVELTKTYTLEDGKLVWTDGGLTVTIPVKVIDHDWELISSVDPTDDMDGTKTYKCKRCADSKEVKIPKLGAEVDTITADPSTIDVSYDIWSGANAADKIADIIRNKVKLTAKMTDDNTYTDLINEATITVDTDSKTAKVSYGGKDAEITLNFSPDPSAAVESIAVTPASLTIAYADWYGKTTEQLAAFIKAYSGYKVTATKSDNTTEDVTEDAAITVTMGSNLTGTATITYDGKTAAISLAFIPSSSAGGTGNRRRPGGGGTFNPGGNTTIIPTPSYDSIFKDLAKDHFAYDAVMDLYKKGIVSGDGNNYIYPENGITREEVAKIALTVNQIPEETSLEIDATDKGDVSSWATNIVATAMKKGILVGYDDGTIRPKQAVTREEMVAMFIRALGVQADNNNTNFSDVSEQAWSAAYVAAASDLGFVKGYEDGTFRPVNNITRAEAFVICHRIMQFRDTLTAAIAG